MVFPTPLQARLSLRVPLMLAPMAGGAGSARLAAAVGAAGGLGSVGSAYFLPEQLTKAVQEVRAATQAPFALSLFAPQTSPPLTPQALEKALADLLPIHARLGIAAPLLPSFIQADFAAQFAAALTAKPTALTFTFGLLEERHLSQLRSANILSIGTACSVSEAQYLAQSGVDAITVQGIQAGGHRGSWAEDSRLNTLELLRAVRQAVKLPLIAAGGIMTREDVKSVLDAGADLASCGTAFLCAYEAGTSAPYRQALLCGGPTELTRAFSGRWARGLSNEATRAIRHPLPTPQQNALTQAMRAAAAAQGKAEYLSLWAGMGVGQVTESSAADIITTLTP